MKAACLLLFGCLSWTADVIAQDRQFKPFKLEVGGGVGIPTSGRAGYIISLELKYALNDQISIGLRDEALVIYQKPFGNLPTVGMLQVRSYSLTGDRYFNLKGRKRLFAGSAVGIYQYARGTVNQDDYRILTRDPFSNIQLGLAPRLGLELSHLRVGIEYNITLRQLDQPVNYFSAKVGLLLGGGRYGRDIK